MPGRNGALTAHWTGSAERPRSHCPLRGLDAQRVHEAVLDVVLVELGSGELAHPEPVQEARGP